ncbi:MAG TPA: DUF2723 domain-containing protein [Blastocatellia bacterium]|nr:DUF2723 domain-containing protein [Blastocatellia bacterium]
MANSKIRIGGPAEEKNPAAETSRSLNSAGLFGAEIIASAIVFVSALVVYTATLAPTVTLVDSGELTVVAASLGVAHPPGFPLYVILSHIATLVPAGSVAQRVNFASALFAALAASTVTLAVVEILRTPSGIAPSKDKAQKRPGRVRSRKKSSLTAPGRPERDRELDSGPGQTLFLLAPALASGFLMAFSRTLWSYATIAEVYTLNTFLIAVIFLLMVMWRRGIIERRSGGREVSGVDGLLYWAAFIFGLALGVHHVTVGMTVFGLAALVYSTEGAGFFASRRLLYAALCSMAGLAIYAFLPIAAAKSPLINWGDPRTLEQLWWHVSGRQYQVFFSFSPEKLGAHFSEFAGYSLREFGPRWFPLAIVLALAGFVRAFKADRALLWFLLLIIAADLAYALNYEIAEDKDAYYLPAFVAITLAAGMGTRWLFSVPGRIKATAGLPAAVAAVIIVSGAALAGNLPYCNRSRYRIAQDYVENALRPIEPGGMLLTLDWQVYSPLLYFREIEHKREDVVAIDVNLLRRSWYFDYLARAYPSLLAASRDKVDAFLEDLKRWEREPKIYDSDPTLNRRINTGFHEMILAFVNTHAQTAPVYVTQEIAPNASNKGDELTSSLASTFQFIPQGLVFKLSTERAYQPPPDLSLVTRGLADGSIAFDENDVVRLKVLPVYVSMLTNRGIYFAANSHFHEAIESFDKALQLDPGYTPARLASNEARANLRQENKPAP